MNIVNNVYEGPILDFILMNASALLVLADKASDFKEGVALARESIKNGNTKKVLEGFTQFTHLNK